MAGSGGADALRQMADRARKLPRDFVKASVKAARKEVSDSLKAATGDGRMSGIGNVRLTIKTSVKGDATTVGTVAAGKPRGPWAWLEEGTKPHIAGGKFKGALHPGTKAKRTWSRAAKAAMADLSPRAREAMRSILSGR